MLKLSSGQLFYECELYFSAFPAPADATTSHCPPGHLRTHHWTRSAQAAGTTDGRGAGGWSGKGWARGGGFGHENNRMMIM